ncbi:hypothetical protein [Bremerella alba]|uniref:Uncharacterized protein n=1 Tax=Bremerella alba TaxID=980252 RepID=A0A7V9A885_9BACT|nr:hypothetical protein [Bremerella alba]MBA2116225.1 hypothetical protein [Bremerella alba]
MVRPSLPYAVLACVAMFVNGCAVSSVPPTVTVWNKLGIPQAFDAANANRVNRRGNNPQRERTPPLKRIADPANMESPNPAIKAAAEIKAEEDLAPQKIKALKYLATIGCGCYDKEGKVEAALLAGLNDCTEEVRKTAAETVLALVGNCSCHDGCGNNCCTEKIQEKLQDMAYGETDGCWHEPSAEIRAIAMQALSACPPISVVPAADDNRETVPTPPVPDRETAPGVGEPLPPIPPPTPMEASISKLQSAEFVALPPAPVQAPEANFYAPINIGFAEEAPAQVVRKSEVKTVSAQAVSTTAPVFIHDQEVDTFVIPEVPVATKPTVVSTKVEFVLDRAKTAVMHMPKTAEVSIGEVLSIQIHSRRGDHTIDGKVKVMKIDDSLVHVSPVDGLALGVLRPGSTISIAR